jgi:PPK2 family polyphosphate:nucleotide phosphotransferase
MGKGPVRLREALRVDPGAKVRLADFDPRETHGRTKDEATADLEAAKLTLAGLQERLWAEHRHRILIVLQGIDTAGKGGTIEHVMEAFPPQGVRIKGFGVPTVEENAHDYLWRVHPHVPGNGEIAIFDRSHYENVLVVRVHDLVPKARWSRRYEQMNAWERMLADEGTTIVKCFLHISKEEQRERLQARVEDPAKRWKFKMGDLEERALWDDYMAAYEEVLRRTSTSWAPWYVIPADRKWFRNLAVSEVLVDVLEELDPQFPPVTEDIPADLVVE